MAITCFSGELLVLNFFRKEDGEQDKERRGRKKTWLYFQRDLFDTYVNERKTSSVFIKRELYILFHLFHRWDSVFSCSFPLSQSPFSCQEKRSKNLDVIQGQDLHVRLGGSWFRIEFIHYVGEMLVQCNKMWGFFLSLFLFFFFFIDSILSLIYVLFTCKIILQLYLYV